jgi:hypothetical protein
MDIYDPKVDLELYIFLGCIGLILIGIVCWVKIIRDGKRDRIKEEDLAASQVNKYTDPEGLEGLVEKGLVQRAMSE